MSAQALRPPQRKGGESHRHHDSILDDAQHDLFAGLWQESPFARLPADAPHELKPFVRDVDNPRRVYAIHRASRRHDFQLLVQLYIHQLRDGCGVATCTTPTCFSCRKRLVGKAPIRRYNQTSARTLAIYLASQDDPARGICPTLKRSKDVAPAVNNVVFSKSSLSKGVKLVPSDSKTQVSSQKPGGHSLPKDDTSTVASHTATTANNTQADVTQSSQRSDSLSKITVSERPVTRDYRSFAATTFGTAAFKMLEWLAPNSMDALTKQISDLESSSQSTASRLPSSSQEQPSVSNKDVRDPDGANDSPPAPQKSSLPTDIRTADMNSAADPRSKKEPLAPKRNPKSTFRSKPTVETARRKSIEPACVTAENDSTTIHRSARVGGYHPDKLSRRTKSPTTITFQPAFFENVPIPLPSADEVTVTSSDGEDHAKESILKPASHDSSHEHKQKQQSPEEVLEEDIDDTQPIEVPLPQALSQLNIELVNFICDVYAEDCTSENQFFGASEISHNYPKPIKVRKSLARRAQRRDAVCRKEWKAFHEQTLFSILSDPAALVSSFTKDGKFFDSHSLWYCLVRLTRASPSLVLHSLWLSAASLFALPDANQQKKGKSKLSTVSQAEGVMSICFHALVALVPVVPDSKTLYDLSRIRSHGLALANSSVSYRRSSSICLEYDDVFSNSLAVRLARRLFLAITVRQQHVKDSFVKQTGTDNALGLLLGQLDLRNVGAERVLEFTQDERLLHETRVPTLLLDWARTVLLHEWNGKAQFYKDGAFCGALSFMDTFCRYLCLL